MQGVPSSDSKCFVVFLLLKQSHGLYEGTRSITLKVSIRSLQGDKKYKIEGVNKVSTRGQEE